MAVTDDPVYISLSNGIRAVCLPYAGGVDYFGITVNAGSRDESAPQHGLAHFVEHTLFKGTAKRRSWHIINRMERVGGELNAFTTKEETVVYSIFPSRNLARAAELIADLVAGSRFPEQELIKEKDVVEDEINSYLDSPADAVFDDFEELIFAGSPLAHNILGTSECLRSFTGADCRRWLDRNFTPGEMTLFYLGGERPDRVRRVLENHFGRMDFPDTPRGRKEPVEVGRFDVTRQLGLHQTHSVWGVRIPGLGDSRSHIYALLANIVGGPGMNSLLNVEMRERRGLVYSVDASAVSYSDCGLLTVYFGADADSLPACRRVMERVLSGLALRSLSPRRLEEAKRQYVGQLAVSSENREQTALSAGRSLLYNGRVITHEERVARIMEITPQQFAEAAATLHPQRFSVLTLS